MPTEDGKSFNILCAKKNSVVGVDAQYVSVDELGINTIFVPTDTKDGRQRWLITSLSGKIVDLK